MSLVRVELRGSWTVIIESDYRVYWDDQEPRFMFIWASPFGCHQYYETAPDSMRMRWGPDVPLSAVVEFLVRFKIAEPERVIAEHFPQVLLEKAYRKMECPS